MKEKFCNSFAGKPIRLTAALFVFSLLPLTGPTRLQAQPPRGAGQGANLVFKSQISPHWLPNDNFWYRNDLHGGAKEFILVDAEKGTREKAFDHARLAAALTKATGTE